jgi:hypothetical protein
VAIAVVGGQRLLRWVNVAWWVLRFVEPDYWNGMLLSPPGGQHGQTGSTPLCIRVAGLAEVLHDRLAVPGALFVASMAAYTLCRQFSLRLRGEHRRSSRTRGVIAVAAALGLCGAILWLPPSAR